MKLDQPEQLLEKISEQVNRRIDFWRSQLGDHANALYITFCELSEILKAVSEAVKKDK